MTEKGETNPWLERSVARVYETSWFAVDHHDVINPGGRPATYGVIRIPRVAVGVLPIDANGSVRLVGQWRFPLGRYSWEMPEGGAERGETPEECARRELREEAGLVAGRLEEILRLDISNSLTDEVGVIFLASDLIGGENAPDETEVLAHRSLPFREALASALRGEIRDGMTVAALLCAYHMAKEGRLPAALARAMIA